VPNLGDVREIDWSNVRRPDLVCGGFPCQPVSQAGDRLGVDDPRWLWPELRRAIGVLRPRWALMENVPGLLSMGFGHVADDLAALGYDFEWECLPAAAFGAPHLRWRVFIVAHASCAGRQQKPGGAPGDEAAHERRSAQDDHQSAGHGQSYGARPMADA